VTAQAGSWPRVSVVGGYRYARFNAATTGAAIGDTNPKALHAVTVGDPGSEVVITLYDGTDDSGDVITVLKPSAAGTFLLDVRADKGLFIVITATTAPEITVAYL